MGRSNPPSARTPNYFLVDSLFLSELGNQGKSKQLYIQFFLTKNPEALQLRDFLFHIGKCSKEDSNLHRFPY
jgi:hypothetical protein